LEGILVVCKLGTGLLEEILVAEIPDGCLHIGSGSLLVVEDIVDDVPQALGSSLCVVCTQLAAGGQVGVGREIGMSDGRDAKVIFRGEVGTPGVEWLVSCKACVDELA